jgi:hypothetical protein
MHSLNKQTNKPAGQHPAGICPPLIPISLLDIIVRFLSLASPYIYKLSFPTALPATIFITYIYIIVIIPETRHLLEELVSYYYIFSSSIEEYVTK